jgi:hypothetical protein
MGRACFSPFVNNAFKIGGNYEDADSDGLHFFGLGTTNSGSTPRIPNAEM